MKNVRTVINAHSVQKIFITSPMIRSDEMGVLVLTDTHMFNFELCDADAIGKEGCWIVKGKVWDKEHAPSVYELGGLLGADDAEMYLEISSSLDRVRDQRVSILLQKVKMSGRKLIIPKDVVLFEELDDKALENYYGELQIMDDGCPF